MTYYFLQAFRVVLLLMATSFWLQAQHLDCGTSYEYGEKIKQRMLDNRRQHSSLMSRYNQARSGNNTVYIPVQFHIVNKTDGTGGEKVQDVLDNLCKLNSDFAPINVEFYMYKPINFVNKDLLYTNDENSGMGSYFMGLLKEPGVVNIFIGNEIISPQGGTILGYYDPNLDAIYAIQDAVNGYSYTLTHEAGHFFSLPHTFAGWERQDYSTVTANSRGRTPKELPNGAIVERLPRTGGQENCQIAGDGFCDTDPSYLFGYYRGVYNRGTHFCEHASAAVDPTGKLFRPDLIRPATRFSMKEDDPAFTELLTTNAFVGTYFPPKTLLLVETSFTPQGGTPTIMWKDTIGNSDTTDYNLQTNSNLIGLGMDQVKIGHISMGDYYLDQNIVVSGSPDVSKSATVPAEYRVIPGGAYTTEMSSLELLNSGTTTISSGITVEVEERLYHKITGLVASESWTIQVATPLPPGTTTLPASNLYKQKSTIAGCTFDIKLEAPYTTVTGTSSENIMSYYSTNCKNTFSAEQAVAMQLDIASRGLSTRYPAPTATLITSQVATIYPVQNITTPNNTVNFSWNAITGATSYHVYVYQVDALGNPLLNGDKLDFIVTSPNLSVSLKPSSKYEWKVTPLNAVSFCDPNTSSSEVLFETGLSTSVTSLNTPLSTLNVYPNPIAQDKVVTLEINSKVVEQVTVSILNALGQEVMPAQSVELIEGVNKNQLDVRTLSAGLYLINVKNKDGIQSSKLVIE